VREVKGECERCDVSAEYERCECKTASGECEGADNAYHTRWQPQPP
jgi:hypothetical protein